MRGSSGWRSCATCWLKRAACRSVSTGYVKYPGGKQSLERTTRNIELALVVDRHVHPSARTDMAAVLRPLRLARLMGGAFDPARVRAAFAVDGDAIVVAREPAARCACPCAASGGFTPMHPRPASLTPRMPKLPRSAFRLRPLRCPPGDRRAVGNHPRQSRRAETGKLAREILRLANKLAHRKNSGHLHRGAEGTA